MKRSLFLTGVLFLTCLFANATITVNIVSPTPGQIVSSKYPNSYLQVKAAVQSTYSITSLVAVVNGDTTQLSYSDLDSVFESDVLLQNMQDNEPFTIVVIATDFFNNRQSDSVSCTYHLFVPIPPKLHVISPIDGSDATAPLAIKVTSNYNDTLVNHIKLMYSFNGTNYSYDFVNTIDTVITFPPGSSNQFISLSYIAENVWGTSAQIFQTAFYETNPYLKKIYTADSSILDFNYNKVLTGHAIVDVTTHDSTAIPFNQNFTHVDNGVLTPTGAFFGPYLLEHDTLHHIPDADGAYDIQAAGNYIAWAAKNDPLVPYIPVLYSENVITEQENVAGGGNDIPADFSLSPDGTVVCASTKGMSTSGNSSSIEIAKNGSSSVLNNDFLYFGQYAQYPVSDGHIVVFFVDDALYNYDIYLFDGTKTTFISSIQVESQFAGPITDHYPYYQISGRYLVYTKQDAGGIWQLWSRDSAGTTKQVTYFNTSSYLRGPNPKGDVFFYNPANGGLNLALHGVAQPPKAYGSIASYGVFYRDSSWYTIEGRNLYKLMVNAYKTVADGNWNDPSIWVGNVVPPDGADVIITNNVTVNTNVTCNSLKVVYPAAVTVLPGFNITVLH